MLGWFYFVSSIFLLFGGIYYNSVIAILMYFIIYFLSGAYKIHFSKPSNATSLDDEEIEALEITSNDNHDLQRFSPVRKTGGRSNGISMEPTVIGKYVLHSEAMARITVLESDLIKKCG